MAANPTLLTAFRTTGPTTGTTTDTVATTSGRKQTLAVSVTPGTGVANTVTIAGWTKVHERNYNAGDLERTVSIWERDGTGTSINATINTPGDVEYLEIIWSWVEWEDVASLRQVTSNQGSSTTPNVTLGAFAGAGNGTLEIIASASELNPTVGTGFTQLSENQGTVQGDWLTVGWRVDNDTSVDASSSTTSDIWGIIGVELVTGGTAAAAYANQANQ